VNGKLTKATGEAGVEDWVFTLRNVGDRETNLQQALKEGALQLLEAEER
jgi:hypothetical protein